jgi:hypothetical protein
LRWCPSPAINVDAENRHSILVEQIATGLGLRLLLGVYLVE